MKRIRYVIGTFILIAMVALNLSFTANAYTEEEKQQAKAWLSAHGYSPDMGGANQAYQDYLNGKFDEELGVDVNGDGIPASTEESATEEDTEEDAELVDEENTETDGETDKEITENAAENLGEATTEVSDEGEETSTQEAVEAISAEGIEDGAVDSINGESTLYQSDKEDEYREAAIVIVLAVVLMLLAGLWLKK